MAGVPPPPIAAREVATPRARLHLHEAGEGEALLLIHGNLSAGTVWRGQLARLPAGVRGLAPDLRGYGRSDAVPVDARRGLRDFSDDLAALLDALRVERAHVAGHSLGGGVAMQLAIDHPARVRSLLLAAPLPPRGFGGTRADGSPCAPDFAGSGGGAAGRELVRRVREGDRSEEHPLSPRNVIRRLFFPRPQDVREEEEILEAMLATRVGDDHWPGDARPSEHWPGTAPGERGVLNACSPRFCDLTPLADGRLAVPVLWVRADRDAIVADASLSDVGQLGALGVIPDWPGAEAFPPQPMVTQTRALLARYPGPVREEVFEETGHFLFTQHPERFAALLAGHLTRAAA